MPTTTVDVEYDIAKDQYRFSGTANKIGRRTIIEEFVRSQTGAGSDDRKATERKVYHIQIVWNPDGDTFRAADDTGNKGLRDGILTNALSRLEKD